jgi:peptidyl-prolyl cis-trans isomerase SurA
MHASLPRRLAGGAVAALLVALVPLTGSAEILEQILVKVNGEIFTKTELEARQVAILRQRNQQMDDQQLKKAIADITPQLLVDTIDEMLLLQRGKELGIKLTDEQFQQVLDNIKKENKIETEAQFQAALKQEGLTMEELRKSIENRMITDRVEQQEIFARINLTEAEERSYYDDHHSEFMSPAQITVREILLKVPGDAKSLNVALDEETKKKAEALRATLASGAEPFEKAVADVSESASKANGGLVGPLNLSELNPAIANLLKPLKAGDITPVVPVQGGYEIFKVEKNAAPALLPFDQARDQIAEKIFNQRRQGEFEKYMRKLRASAIIEWKNPELKKLYDDRLAETGEPRRP